MVFTRLKFAGAPKWRNLAKYFSYGHAAWTIRILDSFCGFDFLKKNIAHQKSAFRKFRKLEIFVAWTSEYHSFEARCALWAVADNKDRRFLTSIACIGRKWFSHASNLLVHQNREISRNICRMDMRLGPSEPLTPFTGSIF